MSKVLERHSAKVILESGNSFITAINGTIEEVKAYYIGQRWDMADGYEIEQGIERYEKCVDCIILN
jgi:hypothetical protein